MVLSLNSRTSVQREHDEAEMLVNTSENRLWARCARLWKGSFSQNTEPITATLQESVVSIGGNHIDVLIAAKTSELTRSEGIIDIRL